MDFVHRTLSIALVALLAAGCAEPSAPSEPTETITPGPTGSGEALFNTTGTAPPPSTTVFNQSFDFFVTYVSPTEGGGTNAGQVNCAWFEPVTMANATATATWTASLPGEEELELVAATFQGNDVEVRAQGPSPLTLHFDFPLSANDAIISVQSLPTGAVQQLAVTLVVTFNHPVDEAPEVNESTCAF